MVLFKTERIKIFHHDINTEISAQRMRRQLLYARSKPWAIEQTLLPKHLKVPMFLQSFLRFPSRGNIVAEAKCFSLIYSLHRS